MADIGYFSLLLTFVFSTYTAVISFIAARKKSAALLATAERSVVAVALLFSAAEYALLLLLVKSDFSVSYVANYTNRELPLFYKITALWAGHDGSLLFWGWLLSIYTLIVMFQYRKTHASFIPYVIGVLMVTEAFFAFLTYFISNPFTLLGVSAQGGVPESFAPGDGNGLNPLLQHPVMAIHPPTLFAGYVGFAIPFAFAIAALITGQLGDTWVKTTRRWTLFSWTFLGAGIFLGAKWAYVELGWGGYWAWDPVENASLMPWLTGTAFIHSGLIQERRGMLKKWNVMLIFLTYLLCVFGTFLTRSGIVSSVHAFAGSSIGPMFAAYLAFGGIVCAGLFFYRLSFLKSDNTLDSIMSRESGFLFNNLVFLMLFFAILWGTMFPVISEAVRGVKISIGPPFFNKITIPLGLLLLFLTAVGPLFAWHKTSLKSLRKNFLLPSMIAIAIAVILLIYKTDPPYAVLSLTLASFVACIIVLEFHRGAAIRRRQADKPYMWAFKDMLWRNKRKYGAHIVHFSVALIFVGLTGEAFNTEIQKEIGAGDSFSLGRYTFTADTVKSTRTANYSMTKVPLTLSNNGKTVAVLEPERRLYFAGEQSSAEVRIYSTLFEDVYAVFSGISENTKKAIVRVYINPLVTWLWIGSIGLILGTIYAMIPNKRHKQRITRTGGKENTVQES